MYIGGHFEKWGCLYFGGKVVGKSKVEQNGDVTVGLTLGVAKDGKGLELNTQIKAANMDGALGGLMKSSLTGSYVTDWVKGMIQKAIDPTNLKQSFPADLNAFNPVIKSAKFVDLGSNKLGVATTAKFSLSQDQAQKIIDSLRNK